MHLSILLQMQSQKSTFKNFKLIHRAMLIGQIIAITIFAFLIFSKSLQPILKQHDRMFQVITLLFTGATFFIGNILFKNKINSIKQTAKLNTQQKFEQYRTASLLQWALLEGATLFNGIAYFLVGNYAFIALAAVIILLFAMQVPNKTKIALQLGLPLHEVEDL
jgi:divalent metal cation (Fe/Co/Zn/Cd) transporter